jgi:HPt (histidine-containing phosphotransfer) domain-containing protein
MLLLRQKRHAIRALEYCRADWAFPVMAGSTALPPPPDIPQGLEHMLPLFVVEMERDARTLERLASAPPPELAEHAHAMRGKAAMFGEDMLFRLLTQVEQDALAGGNGPLPALIARIVERASQLREYQTKDRPES